MQGKQAKIVSPIQERAILGYLATTHYPVRDRVMFLLSMKAGLRAKEMASLTWAMVTDATGQVAEVLHVPNRASKGKTGGRTIPLHPDLQAALVLLQTARGDMATPERPILFSERGGGLSPATVRLWFHRLYTSLKMDGCSSHSGRRTFITRAARRVSQVGGSLRDVQELAGHTSLVDRKFKSPFAVDGRFKSPFAPSGRGCLSAFCRSSRHAGGSRRRLIGVPWAGRAHARRYATPPGRTRC